MRDIGELTVDTGDALHHRDQRYLTHFIQSLFFCYENNQFNFAHAAKADGFPIWKSPNSLISRAAYLDTYIIITHTRVFCI